MYIKLTNNTNWSNLTLVQYKFSLAQVLSTSGRVDGSGISACYGVLISGLRYTS
jgi:hypothetical protein